MKIMPFSYLNDNPLMSFFDVFYKVYTSVLLIIIVTCTGLFSQNWSLNELSPLPQPISNNAVTSGVVDGKTYVYSFGGIDSTKLFSGIQLSAYRYDVSADLWETLDPMPDPRGGKIASSADRIGDTIYIVGGYHVAANLFETTSSVVHRFDIQTNRFIEDAARLPVAIDDQTQVVHNGKLYVISGWSVNTNRRNVQIYDPTTNTWDRANLLENNNDYKVFGSSGTVINNDIYYYGGATLAGDFEGSNVLRKGTINPDNPLDIEWSLITPDISPIGYRTAAVTTGSLIHFVGGSNTTYNFNGIAYNGSGGVSPSETILTYDPTIPGEWNINSIPKLPMDLRSIAPVDENAFIIAGGMETEQKVSDKTYLLTYIGEPNATLDNNNILNLSISPNPVGDELNVLITESIIDMKISNSRGLEVFSSPTSGTDVKLDIAAWESGIYYLRYKNKLGQTFSQSFFKL